MPGKQRMTVTNDTCVISLVGEVDFSNSDQITDWLLNAIDRSPHRLIEIDLSELNFLDSSGIRCFILALRHATNHGAELKTTNPQPNVRRVFTATGVAEVLGIE